MEDLKQQYLKDAGEESPLEDQASKAKENGEAKNGEVNGHSNGEAKNGDSVNQPPQQVSKQVHYSTQTYVARYNTQAFKPVIPKINIAVPTALKGSPVHVQKPYNVPAGLVTNSILCC